MAVYKNVASQKLAVFAYDSTDGSPKTGDAANITAQISLNGGTTAATNDVNPTELDATDAPGIYIFDLTQAETNADLIVVAPVSSTANVEIDPSIIYTTPGSNTALSANVTQMAADVITASAIANDAITDAKVASDVTIASVTGSVGSVAGNVSGSVGSVVGNVGGNVAGSVASVVGAVGSVTGLNVAHIDAAISSRATDSLLITVAGYLDTEIAAIKAKTDQLTFTAAGFVDCNLYRWRGTQPGNLDSNSFVPSNLAAVNGSSTRADTLSAALDGNYLSKLNVSGTLAHTDNATSFMADVSALATKIDVTNAGLL